MQECCRTPDSWRIIEYHHFVQEQENPPQCQRFAVYDWVVEVAYLWQGVRFSCPCRKWWLIIFLLSLLIAVRILLFYLRNYWRMFFRSYNRANSTSRNCLSYDVTIWSALPFCPQRGSKRQPVGDKLLNVNKTHGNTCLG